MKIFEIMKWSVKYENNAVPVSRPFSGAAKLSQTTVCSDKIDRAGPRARTKGATAPGFVFS